MGSLSGFAKEKHPQVHFPNEFAGSVRPAHVWEGPLVPEVWEGPLVPNAAAFAFFAVNEHPDFCDFCHSARKVVVGFLLLVTWLLFVFEQCTYLHLAQVQAIMWQRDCMKG